MNEFSRTWRAAFFAAALILFGIGVASPAVRLFGDYPFSARMAQHLILQLVAPPLFLLSACRKPASNRRSTIGWVLGQPVLTWLLGLGAMWVWHAPALCNAAVRNPALHDFQSLSLLCLGTAFWWPIAGPDAGQRLPPLLGIVYLFTACLGCTILGIVITFAPPGLYFGLTLSGALNEWQFASPEDQRIGGLLMWVPACLVYICGILGLLARCYGTPEPERIS